MSVTYIHVHLNADKDYYRYYCYRDIPSNVEEVKRLLFCFRVSPIH